MDSAEKLVIQNTSGQLLQSVEIDPKTIRITWYWPDAPAKTKANEKGSMVFLVESKAQALLMALVSMAPTQFEGAIVIPLDQVLRTPNTLAS